MKERELMKYEGIKRVVFKRVVLEREEGDD